MIVIRTARQVVAVPTGPASPPGAKGDPGSPGEGYSTRSLMAARASPALKDDVYLTEPGREGKFVVDAASSWTAAIAADAAQGVFVVSTADASKVYRRVVDGSLRPEWFGAEGDDATNDSAAFKALSSVINVLGGGSIDLRAAAVYRAGAQAAGGGLYLQGAPVIDVSNVAFLTLRMHGATIKNVSGLKFGNFNTGTGAPAEPTLPYTDISTRADIGSIVRATNVGIVRISDGTLNGNSAGQTIGGHWGDTGYQCAHRGVELLDCADVELSCVKIDNFLLDGWSYGHTTLSVDDDPRPFVIDNSVVDSCGRNCGSLSASNSVHIRNSAHTRAGHAPITGGTFLGSSPASPIDIETEGGINRNILIEGGTLAAGPGGNTSFVADSGDTADVNFVGVLLIGKLWAAKPRMRFDNCVIRGQIAKLYGDATVPAESTKLIDCHIDDTTTGDTPQIFSGTPSLRYVIDCEGSGPGIQLVRTKLMLNRSGANLRTAETRDCTAVLKAGTEYIPNQSSAFLLDGGRHVRLSLIEAISGTQPADAYYVEGNKVATMIDGVIISPHSKLYWTTWSPGGGGFIGTFDNRITSSKALLLQKELGSFGDFYGYAEVQMGSVMPSTGTFQQGALIIKSNAVANDVLGWKRLTTGSAHVLNTDWVELRAVQQQSAIADLGAAPTQTDFNGLLAKLRTAGVLAP